MLVQSLFLFMIESSDIQVCSMTAIHIHSLLSIIIIIIIITIIIINHHQSSSSLSSPSQRDWSLNLSSPHQHYYMRMRQVKKCPYKELRDYAYFFMDIFYGIRWSLLRKWAIWRRNCMYDFYDILSTADIFYEHFIYSLWTFEYFHGCMSNNKLGDQCQWPLATVQISRHDSRAQCVLP